MVFHHSVASVRHFQVDAVLGKQFPILAHYFQEAVIQQHCLLLQEGMEQGMAPGEFHQLPSDLVVRILVATMIMTVLWIHSHKPLNFVR